MKKYLYIIPIAVLIIACGGNDESSSELDKTNLEQVRAKRALLKEDESKIIAQIEELDEIIAKLDTTKKLPLITIKNIATEEFEHFIELQGNVQTKNNLVLYSEYAGQLNAVNVKEGDRVSKGQVLARIDDGGLGQQRAQLEVQMNLAKTTYEKQERLWKQNIGSELSYLQAKANYEAQEKAISQLDAQLAKTSIRAPFSGMIDEVITEKGSMVSPGMTPVIRIVNNSDMYVEVDVPEAHLRNIQKGNKAMVSIPVLGKELESKIRSVGSFVNPANRTFKIELAIANKDGLIKPNLNAKVKINDYNNEEAVLIAQSLISEDSQGREYVYVVKDKDNNEAISERAYISTGLTSGDMIEVLEGLSTDQEIVVEGARAIREGQKVKIKNS
ncbi:MAG: efflux RND transporter periplasmic adaptor subunit [Bacteroidota bacterium]